MLRVLTSFRHRASRTLAIVGIVAPLGLTGCAAMGMGGTSSSACIDFSADGNLPHPVTLWVFALETPLKFEQEPIANLLDGV